MDSVPSEVRSRIMSRIRGKDTGPERAVRSFLHKAGLRFRIHKKGLPGTPDIVLPRYRTVVFVHGCFWHQHPGCHHYGVPRSNTPYWQAKFERIAERDARKARELAALGWTVRVVWECEVSDEELQRLADSIKARPLTRPRSASAAGRPRRRRPSPSPGSP
ncbi:MAG: very short patch repair endonuclease [Thermoanaerobaculia bacterium]